MGQKICIIFWFEKMLARVFSTLGDKKKLKKRKEGRVGSVNL